MSESMQDSWESKPGWSSESCNTVSMECAKLGLLKARIILPDWLDCRQVKWESRPKVKSKSGLS
jgi:hypothetical protein